MENRFIPELYSNRVIKHQETSSDLKIFSEDSFDRVREYFESIELKKTSENILVINEFNKYLQEEAGSLGVEVAPFSEEKIKLLTEEEYNNFFNNERKSFGSYLSEVGCIFLKNTSLRAYHTLMHELVHYYSFHKVVFNEENDFLVSRIGYDDIMVRNFIGFNEGVTEFVASDILSKHQKEITKDIADFSNENLVDDEKEAFFKPSVGRYSGFMKMLLNKMSEKSNTPQEEIFSKFKEGLFTGNMMYLREIEKIFGKDSLRVLAYYDIYNSQETDLMIYNYFKNFEDENQKNKILETLEKVRQDESL